MDNAAADANPIYFGLKLYELLTLAGVFAGPVIAVLITLWAEHRRRVREARSRILSMLLNTRSMPSDSAYTIAINMIPVEFNGKKKVITAWKEYIECVRYKPSDENREAHDKTLAAKQTALIFKIMQSLGIGLSETDIQTQGYVADGYIWRDNLYIGSLAAMIDIAAASKRSAIAAETLVQNASKDAGYPHHIDSSK